MMRRWLKSQRAPAGVQRKLEQLERLAEGGFASEVDTCFECGTAHFVSDLVDLSTQEYRLVLCGRCHERRTKLLAMEERHYPTRQYRCLCGKPIESPIHYAQEDTNG